MSKIKLNGQSSEFRVYFVEGYINRTVSSRQLENEDCRYFLFEGIAYSKRNSANYGLYFDHFKKEWFKPIGDINEDIYAYGFVQVDGDLRGWFTRNTDTIVTGRGCYPYLNRDVAISRGCVYCEDCNVWNNPDRMCDCQRVRNCADYCFDYHSVTREDMSNDSRFKIGIEVEKEDFGMYEYEQAREVYQKGWIKERDSSLDEESGFELISHTLDLYNCYDAIDKVKYYIDAEYSSNCGGHIHISDKQTSPRNLFNSILGYLPLFYALYPNRIDKTYSEAKPKNHYGSDHYSSFAIHSKTLEFRIFPSPKNTDVLKWRIELLRIVLENPFDTADKVQDFMLDIHSALFKHLIKAYSVTGFVRMYKRLLALSKRIDGETLQEKSIKDIERISQRVLTEV
jgi:hypothetical protein